VNLLRRIGAEVVAACFVIDLPDLGGADRLRALDEDHPVARLHRVGMDLHLVGAVFEGVGDRDRGAASSSTCRTSAAPTACAPSTCRCGR
jgi:hypothetical protein